ncbi:dynamin family protein [Iningainema tapete]|uniref:Dynamin family protein n=1 Tax=Iningainema tapete BLCC-T55 TaxID=2748662 RepID=A0A8J7BZ32_9CYAN|nr:dynamin family protein [Iningainema tapete]MBD2776792.1 dynamin family protein [Iningainema tapete BLCC-T55]
MTMLPTEVVFQAELKEPVLTLSDQILEVFQDTLLALRSREQMDKETQQEMNKYPHLTDLLRKIQDQQELAFNKENNGREQIIDTLTVLNDIIRLCSIIEPSCDPLGKLLEVPRVKTPFWRLATSNQSQMLGNLVIVDTPGPNKAGENLRLAAVVADQLKKSSMVLIVLDFTQLNTKAAEEVKKQIKPVIELLGKDNLYALVNKVDQRRKDGMTLEQVQEFVAADLQISNSETKRVFEVSARRAFYAADFLQEADNYSESELQHKPKARALAEEVYGFDWEDELKVATVEALKDKAEKLWKKSGFTPFLEKALNNILEQVAPRCIKSALKLSLNRLKALSSDLSLQISSLEQDESKIRSEIEALQADMGELETRRELYQPQIDQIIFDLKNDINDCLDKIKYKFLHTLDYSKLENAKSYSVAFSPLLNDFDFQKILNCQPIQLTNIFLNHLKRINITNFTFVSKEEAENACHQVSDCLKEFIGVLITKINQNIEAIINYHANRVHHVLNEHVMKIIENAQKRLEEKFNISLCLEAPKFKINAINLLTYLRNQSISESKVDISIKLHNYFIKFFNYKVERLIIKEKNYYINLASYVNFANELIFQQVTEIEQELQLFLSEDFDYRINYYLESLKGYLTNYQVNLAQAIKDKSLSAEEFKNLKQTLYSLMQETKELTEQANQLLHRSSNW